MCTFLGIMDILRTCVVYFDRSYINIFGCHLRIKILALPLDGRMSTCVTRVGWRKIKEIAKKLKKRGVWERGQGWRGVRES